MTSNDNTIAAEGVWREYLGRQLGGDPKPFEQLCDEHPHLEEELRRCRDDWSPPTPPQSGETRKPEPSELKALMLRLARPATRCHRYQIERDIGRGAMGVVQRVWDRDLKRQLAMKTMHARANENWKQLASRFIEEAQIIAQLDHPSIVPVHDLGLNDFGRPFFIMKLVHGQQLGRVFEFAWERRDGWTTARVLGCFLHVCEAVGYAHSKGVVHRDLKPSNVMVGARGDVYVMDWGVARVLRRAQSQHNPNDTRVVETLRSARAKDESGSLFTMQGQIVGTAAYMSPEQANGELASVDARSDVYALGAMLYHFLARCAPYGARGESTAQVIAQVRAAPPKALRVRAPGAPAELVAICEKAMSRDLEQRYANLAECADDLRAFLEVRVVRAHRNSRLAHLGKWIRRRPIVAAVATSVLITAPLLTWKLRDGAVAQAGMRELAEVTTPSELLESYELLWPATLSRRAVLERWLASAEAFNARLDDYRNRLERLRAMATANTAESAAERKLALELEEQRQRGVRYYEFLQEQYDWLLSTGEPYTFDGSTRGSIEEQLERDRSEVEYRQAAKVVSYRMARLEDQLIHDRLADALASFEELAASNHEGTSRIDHVRRALAHLDDRARADKQLEARMWREACESIANETDCPLYRGLRIEAQEGLLPLGRNPSTGLWEFAHLQSGAPAQLDARGRTVMQEDTGVILILIPGGQLRQGGQRESLDEPNYDPNAQVDEGPLVSVFLQPFFISKYELTQAQWERWRKNNPSRDPHLAGDPRSFASGILPVDTVSWLEARRFVVELGLTLPTEAQWERAVRGETQTPWANAPEPAELHRFANLRDPTFTQVPGYREGSESTPRPDASLASDGYFWTAPVGSFEPTSWGLHDALGNVSEWTGDRGHMSFRAGRWLDTGERSYQRNEGDMGGRVARGGNWSSIALEARVMSRAYHGERAFTVDMGIRPARSLDPGAPRSFEYKKSVRRR